MILRKLFHKKPPDGLLEISERVYVFDCCFSTNVWKEETFKVYMKGTVSNLVNHFPDSSFLVFNFCEDETKSHMAELLANYDMTIMDYPRQYEGCPLLAMEMLHHFLRSSESWLSLGQHNFLLMHCEWGGWPVMAFMLSALLIYMKQYRRELKTLDMIYCQAPHELLRLLSPLNPIPSQLRYLQYVARRNVASEWPPADRALTLDCIILRHIPNVDGNGGCRPIFRIYGQDPLLVADKTPKVLYSTPKRSSSARYYKERVSALVKIDINCHVQGDVVVECISLSNDMEREEMIFRAAFNTAFIRSNILMLNCDEIDTLWDAKELFPKEFRAEILFSEMDAASSTISLNFPTFEEKEGLPMEAFAKVHEIFNGVDWSDPKTDVAFDMLRQMGDSNFLQEKSDSDQNNSVVVSPKQHGLNSENVKAETGSLSQQSTRGPSTMDRKIPYALSKQTSLDSDTSVETKPQDSHVDHFNQSNVTNQQNNQSIAESILHDSSEVSHLNALSEAVVNHSLAASPKIEAENKIISLAPPTPSVAVQPPSISCATKAPPQPPLSPPLLTPLSSVSTSEKSSPTKDSGTQTQDKDQSAFAKGTLRHKTLHPAATSKTSSSTSSLAAPPPPPAPPLKDNQTISNIHTETPRATHVSPKEPLSLKENLVLRLNTPAASVDTPASPQNESAAVRKGCPAVPSSPPLAPVRTRCPVAPPPPPPKMSLKENSAFRSASPPHLSQVASLAASSSAPPPPSHLSQVASLAASSSAPPPPSHSSQVTSPAASSIPPHPPYSSQVASPAGSSSAPPPPPPLSSSSSPRNKLLSRTISSKSNQKKLKPLHWLKLSRAVQGSLWAEAQILGEASKTPEIDMSELENLFSAAAPKTNNGVKSNSRAPHAPKTDKVQLVELRRACNCEIMLSKVKMPLPELMNSVLALEESALDIDQVENLIKFCPTKEEMEALKGYTGEREKLGKCEQFFLELMRAPRVESKLNVFAFKIEFRSQVSDLRNRLNVVNSATEEIRTSVKLKRIMQTILTLGNALNQGTARGSAVGFRLDSLLKLTDTRARNNKITLMHYLCKVVADKLPDLLDFSDEIPSLEPASKVELKYLAEEMQSISKGLEKVVQELSSSESDGPTSEKFCKTLKEFLSFAEAEVRSLTSLYAGVGRNVDALIVYFGEDPAHCPFEQVTATLLNFVKMFNKAREDAENSKKLEQEIKKSAEVEKQNAQNDPANH